MNKYQGGITLIVFGIALILLYLLVPRNLPGNWFIESGVDGRLRSRVFGVAMILLGVIVLMFG